MNRSESPPPSSEPPPDNKNGTYATSSLVIDTPDSVTRLFSVLANEESRHIIYALFREEKTTVPLSQLVGAVAATVDDDDSEIRRRMVRTHLPNLGLLGIVDYDLEGDPRVWLSENVDIVDKQLLDDIIERVEQYERV